jgi:hypothetical protein
MAGASFAKLAGSSILVLTQTGIQNTTRFGFRGAQAANLFVLAACRDRGFQRRGEFEDVADKLPTTTGWQPVLPRKTRRNASAC